MQHLIPSFIIFGNEKNFNSQVTFNIEKYYPHADIRLLELNFYTGGYFFFD